MADAIARVVNETVTVTIQGTDLLAPILATVQASATEVEADRSAASASAATATAAAGVAGGHATTAGGHATTAAGYLAAVLDAVDGLPVDATLPLQAVSRTALAAFTGMVAGRQAILTEAGREGLFTWSTANESAGVTADPYQGIYVPPASDTDGSSGAWVRVVIGSTGFVDWFGPTKDGAANDAPKINSALVQPKLKTVLLGAGSYGVSQSIYHPGGKALRGVSREATTIEVLPWGDFAHNRVITGGVGGTEDYDVVGMEVSDITIDGNKVGEGGGPNQRITLFAPSGTRFLVERCRGKDSTGYQFYGRGESIFTKRAGGTFRDCLAENGDTLFETTYCKGVVFENCHGTDGAGDLPCENAFIAWAGSSDVTFRDCSFVGTAGVAATVLSTDRDALNIVFDNVRVENGANVAFNIEGNFVSYVSLINCRFVGFQGANVANARLTAVNCHFEGEIGYVANGNSELLATNCTGIGVNAVSPAYGLYIEGGDPDLQHWNGGKLEAGSQAASAAFTGGNVSAHTLLSPAVPGHPIYNGGTTLAVTAGTGMTVEDFGFGRYRLTKTTTAGSGISTAYTAAASIPAGPFVITAIPSENDEFWFGVTDASTTATNSDLDTGLWLRPTVLKLASGAEVEDQMPRARPLHIVRDVDDNIAYFAGGQTERDGNLIKVISASDHGGALSGAFKAAFALTEQDQVLDVRVATR